MSLHVTVTGASGLIGRALCSRLAHEDVHTTVLTRDPSRFAAAAEIAAVHRWDPSAQPAPTEALQDADAVIHLAGEPIAQRWTAAAKQRIRDSRVQGTENLVRGIAACPPQRRPRTLIAASAVGYYGPHGIEPLDEEAPAGSDFLARVCVDWERESEQASGLGVRVVRLRNGVVLDPRGGALAKMLPPFRAGVGGPVAGGGQYISWIHVEDLTGMIVAAIGNTAWVGAVNATAPEPVSNREFSKALGRALRRPALLPVPGAALRVLYGEMAEIITTGARVVPARALMLDYRFVHPQLDEALRDALG